MSYCIKCGKPNTGTARFCTTCGATLTGKSQTTGSAESPTGKKPEQGNKIKWIIIGGLAVLLTTAVAYYIFILSTIKTDTTVAPAPSVRVSDRVPLKPAIQETEVTLSQSEVDIISRKIYEFYDYEAKEDIPNLFSYYQFPLDRYYQLYNVSYDKLHKMMIEAFKGKLYYHNIKINWNYSTVQKLSTGGFKVLLSAIYTYASESNDDRKSKNIHLVILMNNNYKITSIYSD